MNSLLENISNVFYSWKHNQLNIRTIIVTGLLALMLAVFIGFGKSLEIHGAIQYGSPRLWLTILVRAAFIFFILSIIWFVADRFEWFKTKTANYKFLPYAIAAVAVLCITWGISFLASYPGYYAYDTKYTTKFVETGILDPNQSTLFVLVTGSLIKLGSLLFGSFNSGVAFYTLVQIAVVIASVVAILRFLYLQNAPRLFIAISIIYFALDPIIVLHVNCITKDTFFAVFLVLLGITYILMLQWKNDTPTRQKASLVVFNIFCALMCCAYRRNGLYALAALVIFIAIMALISRNKDLLFRVIIPTILSISVFVACSWLLAMTTAPSSEDDHPAYGGMLLVPHMQIGRMASMGKLIDEEKLAALGVDMINLKRGNVSEPNLADWSSSVIISALDSPEKESAYIELWRENVIANPGIAMDAFLELTKGAWSPFAKVNAYPDVESYFYSVSKTSLFACYVEQPAYLDSKIPWLQQIFWDISRNDLLGSNPLLAWSVSVPFFFWMMLVALGRSIIVKNRSGIVYSLLMLCCCLTLLIGPGVICRYYLCLFFSAPLFAMFILTTKSSHVPRHSHHGLHA